MKKFLITLFCAVLSLSFSVQAQDDEANLQTVENLLKEGFSSQEIIGFIDAASTRTLKPDLATIRALKAAGADTELITYIQKIGKTDFGYEGVYLWNTEDGKPIKLLHSALEKQKKGFGGGLLGSAVAIGGAIAGINANSVTGVGTSLIAGELLGSGNIKSEKLILPGKQARVVASQNPVFRFYFPKDKSSDTFGNDDKQWFSQWMTTIESPADFQLLKMDQKKDKRSIPSGLSWGIAGFQSKDGGKKVGVPFDINQMNNSTFEVTFPNGLEPGEYCFFFTNLNNEWFAKHLCVFDFEVE